ncbi:flagellar basal body-associated protein FliL [Lentibacillus persicus]|nr:flagellar basal body-associated protein FliL [Lentibacillus persicus]
MGKLTKIMMTSFAVLLLAAGAALVIVLNITGGPDEGSAQSIDKVLDHSYETPEITTDLKDGSFVRIQFQIVTDSDKAKKEAEKREFQLKNILIKELATMEKDKFKSGLSDLEAAVQLKLNEVMEKGKITEVYTVNKIIQ